MFDLKVDYYILNHLVWNSVFFL